MSKIKLKNAFISLTDKSKIEILAKELVKKNINIISTGGTAKYLKSHSISVTDVNEITNFPEILDGRVKSLHPKIFGGILYRRDNNNDLKTINKLKITSIDLVIVNLYRFNEIRKSSPQKEIIEHIDIGGPSLIRAAAKNYLYTTVIVDPKDYEILINKIKNNTIIDLNFRKLLAAKAFKLTSEYDKLIFKWLDIEKSKEKILPNNLDFSLTKSFQMRYGENPHQKAALYKSEGTNKNIGIANYKQLQGKDLSYNNFNDTDAAFELVNEFSNPAVAIIKHANPCGVSEQKNILLAWDNAFNTDPTSAFGGIVALNRPINEEIAKKMSQIFLEVIIAPGISKKAEIILNNKKNLRVLICNFKKIKNQIHIRSISGGFLIQDKDDGILTNDNFKIVTRKKPTDREIKDLKFAWIVAKHTKSNAIIFSKNSSTIGIGAGQMSRIDSVIIAKDKYRRNLVSNKNRNITLKGSVLSSDAFFPFSDTLIYAAEAGVTSIIQPGGSIRDEEIINEANKRNISMIFTSVRHFKH